MENKNTPENSGMNIREALGKLNVDYVDARVTERSLDDGAIEFDFSDESSYGFIFEDETGIPENKEKAAVADELKESSPKEEPHKDEPAEKEEEFLVPEQFEAEARFDTPETPNEQTKIWATYVPRFTEVSDNYRMSGDSRPQPEALTGEAAECDPTDPTAEIDAEVSDAVTVSSTGDVKLEDFAETLNVYKFGAESNDAIPKAEKIEFSEPEVAVEPEAAIDNELKQEEEIPTPQEPTRQRRVEIPDPNSTSQIVECEEPKGAGSLLKYEPSAIAPALPQKNLKSGEYTAFFQRDNFKDKFLDGILSVKIRLFSLAFIALVLLVYENLYIFGVDVAGLLKISAARGAVALIDLHLCFCAFALALPEIITAVKLLFKKQLVPELILIPTFIAVAVMTVEDYISMNKAPMLVGLVFAVEAFSAVLGACVRKSADFTAFKSVSQNGDKKALEISETKALPKENIALDGAVDGYKSRTIRLFRTSFVSDFFKTASKVRESNPVNIILLSSSLGVALIVAIISGIFNDGISSATDAFALVLLAAIPAFGILLHKLPYSKAERASNDNKTVLIGENSLYEVAEADVITFEDTEIFGTEDVVLKRFMLYGDKENMAKAMRQMSALFSAVGGPLEYIFSNSLDKRPVPATSVTIEPAGISGSVDGKRIFAGTYEYMRERGLIAEQDTQDAVGADTTKIMYAAEEGSVYAKFYIRYSFSEAFTEILPDIRKNGIVPLVYTRDPNISNELLKTLTAGQGTIRVMKKTDRPSSDVKSYTKLDAGVVTFGDKMNAIAAVLLAKKYTALQEKLLKTELVLTALGAITAAVLVLLGIKVPSVGIAVWQVALAVGLNIVSARALLPKKRKG